MSEQARTYQTRLSLDAAQETALAAYADLYCTVERKLFAAICAGGNPDKLKTAFSRTYKLTARQYNAISRNLKGKIKSVTILQATQIEELKARINRAEKVITKVKNPAKRHHKKRRLAALVARLAQKTEAAANGKVNICFGSRKLFGKQFYLADNGYASHDEWKADWKKARNNQFFVVGSKDENAGCQGCVATTDPDGNIILRLRLPDALAKDIGKYILIDGVRFPYGQEHIVAALSARQSVSYRFLRDAVGWRVFVTTDMPIVDVVSRRQLGAVGIDINADCLAVSEIDHYGNFVTSKSKVIPCVTYGKTTNQATAVIGNAVRDILDLVVVSGKPIVIEKLDFTKKKAALEGENVRHNRMISSLAYNRIIQTIRARAYMAGIEVIEVNPAFTSTIGKVNYADKYGISVHQGAALAIARRGLGFTEKPASAGEVILPDGVHLTFVLPARNRAKHIWMQWAGIRKNLVTALAAHRRLSKTSPSWPLKPSLGAIRLLPAKLRHVSQQCCSAGDLDDVPHFRECLSIF
ncbi:MAG TPA: IS200/IS605 family accessory protein TnpB-related protein [Candidatus Hydrogenedentes bacterium]|nr:IS200/IS605 family accessory protein TnpB-related protein [Candidatus Hydrogenedentota bacterium]